LKFDKLNTRRGARGLLTVDSQQDPFEGQLVEKEPETSQTPQLDGIDAA